MRMFSRRDFIRDSTLSVASPYLADLKTGTASTEKGGSDARSVYSATVRDTYDGERLRHIAFPMGGIGTGSIGFSGTGKLIDWEIFNNPNRGYQPFQSFLSVFAQPDGESPSFRVLEGSWQQSLEGPMYVTRDMWQDANGCGPQQTEAAGLPRMRHCRFVGRFPFAQVDLSNPGFPLAATIEGWSPFIPGNADDSSIPAAMLNVRLHNPGTKTVRGAVAINLQNRAGGRNSFVTERGFAMLYMDSEQNENAMFLASPQQPSSWQLNWTSRGGMQFMYLQHFVDTFAATGKLDENAANPGTPKATSDEHEKIGSLAFDFTIAPGESHSIPLIIGWYFPIFNTADPAEMTPGQVPWRNWYGTRWKSGAEVARYCVANLPRLEAESRLFQKSFFASTLPGQVLEAASTQLSILKSTTVIRYPDGTLYGWEGSTINRRLGYGTVNHVWNYQQAIPYLFPDLQRSILNNFYTNGFRESDGAIQFRVPAGPDAKAEAMPATFQNPFGARGNHAEMSNFFSAADGQFGLIAQVFRDWQISGDTEWLRTIWPRVRKSLEFAWTYWDQDRDGLLEGPHHNTLDLNFTTPDTMCGSEYQVALLAGEQMALAMNDHDAAREFRRVFESGKQLSDIELFNGEYYQQKTPAPGLYQLGSGCISDQLTGQLYARMLGLEDIYNSDHIRKALRNIYRYNFRSSMRDVLNVDRPFSINDEAGLMIATWPHGERPEQPLLYCTETMPGFEYQAAFNLIYAGMIEEGLTIIRAIRERYDGENRNPFCEIEWGNHYARSLISYAGMLAFSRFRYSAVNRSLQFAPQISKQAFCQFFSIGWAWGNVRQFVSHPSHRIVVEVHRGELHLDEILIQAASEVRRATVIAGTIRGECTWQLRKVAGRPEDSYTAIHFPATLTTRADSSLTLELSLA